MEPSYQILQNGTAPTELILLGLSSNPKAQLILFAIFLLIYLVALTGSTLLLLAISLNKTLHSPMYFFLGNLSVVDIGYTTSTVPRMLMNYLSTKKTVSLAGCLSQLYFFMSFGTIENLLLGVMAYDRYAAICHPLHYGMLMRPKVCAALAAVAWVGGLANACVHSGMMSRLSFCWNNVIHNFYCDLQPLFHLSCSDTRVNKIVVLVVGGGVNMTAFMVIVVSYSFIVLTVLRMRTKDAHQKAFSTCASHLIVVNKHYSSGIVTCLLPSSPHSQEKDRILPILYGIVTPMLNSIIYSLRNKDVKGAIQKSINLMK